MFTSTLIRNPAQEGTIVNMLAFQLKTYDVISGVGNLVHHFVQVISRVYHISL